MIDLIYTDILYYLRWLPNLKRFAPWVVRKLRPGGVVALMSTTMFPSRVYSYMSHRQLKDHGELCIHQPNSKQRIPSRGRINKHRPIRLWAKRGGKIYVPNPPIESVYVSNLKEKDRSPLQQDLGAAKYFIGGLSQPGDLIVDPFCGSGTFPRAVIELGQGRRCICGDIDPDMVAKTKREITEAREMLAMAAD